MTGKRIGVLAGAFNPVTCAHLALINAALEVVDEAVCVVPRVYPHKEFYGAALQDRLEMLRLAGGRYRVEVTERGLFIDIARELRRTDPGAEIHFICGRDAAERIVTWDYGEPGAVERMFQEFQGQATQFPNSATDQPKGFAWEFGNCVACPPNSGTRGIAIGPPRVAPYWLRWKLPVRTGHSRSTYPRPFTCS